MLRISIALFALFGTVCLAIFYFFYFNASIFVEIHEVTNGDINGLVIGMPISQVLKVAKGLGAKTITPVPCLKFGVSGADPNNLPPLAELEGVRVTNSQGAFADIYFANGFVSRIVHTPRIHFMTATTVGDPLSRVHAQLLSNLETSQGLVVRPIVDSKIQGIVVIAHATAIELRSHRCWQFETNAVRPAGAVYEIEFGNDSLRRVGYRRPRIRIE